MCYYGMGWDDPLRLLAASVVSDVVGVKDSKLLNFLNKGLGFAPGETLAQVSVLLDLL